MSCKGGSDNQDPCIVYGIAYDAILDDDQCPPSMNKYQFKNRILQPTTKLLIQQSCGDDDEHKEQIYTDPAIRIRKTDIQHLEIIGKPLRDTHNKENIGVITDYWVKNNKIMIVGKVWDQNIAGKIRSGEYGSFSIGYTVNYTKDNQFGSNMLSVSGPPLIEEFTVCPIPVFERCKILVNAAKSQSKPQLLKNLINRQTTSKTSSGFLKKLISYDKKKDNGVKLNTNKKGGQNEIKILGYKDNISSEGLEKSELLPIVAVAATNSFLKPTTTSENKHLFKDNNNMTTTEQQPPLASTQQPPPNAAATGGTAAPNAVSPNDVRRMVEQMATLRKENDNLKASEKHYMQSYQDKQRPNLKLVTEFVAERLKVDDIEKLPESIKTLLIESFTDMNRSDVAEFLSTVVTNITEQNGTLTKQTETITTMTEKMAQFEAASAENANIASSLQDVFTNNNNNNAAAASQQQQNPTPSQQIPPVMQSGGGGLGGLMNNFGKRSAPWSLNPSTPLNVTASKRQKQTHPVNTNNNSLTSKLIGNYQTRSGAENNPMLEKLLAMPKPNIHDNAFSQASDTLKFHMIEAGKSRL